jgi:hypothetical protein
MTRPWPPVLAAATICGLMLAATVPAKERIPMSQTDRTDVRTSRPPPPEVRPVTIGSVRYSPRLGTVQADGQVGGLLAAYAADGGLLWTLKVYDNRRSDDLEGDVQDVFFSELSLEPDGRLRIVNENGDTFLVDVNMRNVTALPREKKADDDGLWPD